MGTKYKIMKFLVRNKKLTPGERLASRVGYFGAGCFPAGNSCTSR